ncbi:MAG: pyridoxine 5'-phosphate oxidase C-terminal domain-containing protein, partial [Crocinitomicaceae bacterium]
HQSEKLENRTDLADRIKELHLKFPGEVPRPPHWGGFVVIPHLYEFWQGRPSRLHDRICFQKNGNQWVVFRKNP